MSLWRIIWTAAIFGLPPALAASNSGLIQVTDVRSWTRSDSTRVIIQTTGPFEFRSDHANNPDRLFVDILHARPWIAKRRFATHEIGDNLFRRVRIAETSPGTTRVVFDLANPADFKITKLDAPDRMVVELRPLRSPNSPRSLHIARLRCYTQACPRFAAIPSCTLRRPDERKYRCRQLRRRCFPACSRLAHCRQAHYRQRRSRSRSTSPISWRPSRLRFRRSLQARYMPLRRLG